MPTMANITVKKADGTTDVIYVAATPSSGDKNPAIWTLNSVSGIQGFRPRFELQTQDNGNSSMRQARVKYSFPATYVDSTTGLTRLNKSFGFEGSAFMPKDLTTTEWKEAWAQLGNLLCSALVRSSIEEGYSPT